MDYGTSVLKTEYSDASVDDILAEYQYEQRSAASQARYEAFIQEESEPESSFETDGEGVKVYRPKKSSSLSPAEPPQDEGGADAQESFSVRQSGFTYYPRYQESQYYDSEDLSSDEAFGQAFDDAMSRSSEEYYSRQEYSGGEDYYGDYDTGYEEDYSYGGGQEEFSGYPGEEQPEQEEYIPQDAPEQYSPEYAESLYYMAQEQDFSASGYAEDYAGQEYSDGENYSEEAYAGETQAEEPQEEIDPRFNLSGAPKAAMYYGGRMLDTSPEENYIPPSSPYSLPIAEDRDSFEEPQEEEGRKKKKRFGLFSGRKNKKAPLNAPPEDSGYEELSRGAAEAGCEEAPGYEEPCTEADSQYERAPSPEDEAQYEQESSGPQVTGFSDDGGAEGSASYAPQEDYADSPYSDEDDYIPEYSFPQTDGFKKQGRGRRKQHEDDFPSFGQFVLEYITGILYKFKSAGDSDGSTMDTSDEDLGRELSPMKASKYYGSYVHSMRLRLRISLIVILVMAYISLGFPVTGMLKTLPVQAALLLGAQLCVMLLSLDVLTGAVMNIFRGRFGTDSLTAVLCILTAADAVAVNTGTLGSPHTPLCLLSALSLAGVLLSSLLSARGIRKALRVPAIGKTVYTVTGESGVKGSGLTLLKSVRSSSGFVRRTEEAGPDETVFSKLCPLLLALCLLLSIIVAAAKGAWSEYLFILTAFITPAVPIAALLSFALPFFVGSMRIFTSGASIAGWSGLCDIGSSKNLVVTDRDLFPQGSVEIENILILDDMPSEKIISYAGTMLSASGTGIASCFVSLMEKNGCGMQKLQDFECMAGGGLKGIIDGDTVLCGGLELMHLMNVPVPYRQIKKTPVLLAINGVLYGIFNMKYTAQPQVRKALIGLIRSNRHPIFAVRDFNISPEMLRESFDVATDGYDFPPYVERYSISEAKPAESSKVSAVVCREGLAPLTHMADTGRSMYMATRVNIVISIAAALIGVLAVLIKFLSAGAASPEFFLLYTLLMALPVAATSFVLKF